jgi:hypothetical protein
MYLAGSLLIIAQPLRTLLSRRREWLTKRWQVV